MEKNYHIEYETLKEGSKTFIYVKASCLRCGNYTEKLSTKAKNKKEALNNILNGEGVCEECYVNKAYRPLVFHL